jgi:hypothetical protein
MSIAGAHDAVDVELVPSVPGVFLLDFGYRRGETLHGVCLSLVAVLSECRKDPGVRVTPRTCEE